MANWFPIFSSAIPIGTTWSSLKIGAGGYITGIDIAPDGTMVIRADTFGAYKWNGTGWTLLTNSSSLPVGSFGHNASGDWLGAEGVYEIVIAPNNTSRFYMMFRGRVYRTDNSGVSWTLTNFTAVLNCDPNSGGRTRGQTMAVDPNDSNICFVGTASDGLWKTSNAGTSWTQVSTGQVPLATLSTGSILVAFDTSSILYAASYGNGVYRSTDGGTNWTLTTSSPATSYKMIVRGGVVYHIDDQGSQGNLRKYTGTWSSIFQVNNGDQDSRCSAVDVDPSNSSRIIVIGDGGFQSITTNGGTTWTGWNAFDSTRSAGVGEPGWLATTQEIFMSCGNARFHPINSNELWFAEGIGVWKANPSNSVGTIAYSAKSQGIEQIVANGTISPPGFSPLFYGWDRPIFRSADPFAYPANQGPNNNVAITVGTGADWASSSPGTVVLNASYLGTNNAFSSDGGQTWTNFTGPGTFGGNIAASTPTKWCWIGASTLTIHYTTNGGASPTWNTGSITGPAVESFLNAGAGINKQILCADRVNADTYYVYYNGHANSDGAGTNSATIAGIYKSTDAGANWTKIFAGRLGNTGSPNNDYADGYYAVKLRSVPNIASTSTAGHLFWTGGDFGGSVTGGFGRSFDGGVTWGYVTGVLEVLDVGFGAPAPGGDYPAVYIAGWVGGTAEANYGIHRSTSTAAQWAANTQTWTKLTDYPYGNNDFIKSISGDSNTYGKVYVGFIGSGWAYGR